jgi:hypothetical protein
MKFSLPLFFLFLLSAASALADPVCADTPPGEVLSFEAPPPPSPGLRAALVAGRAYLRRGEVMAAGCAHSASAMKRGYVVATLSRAGVHFAGADEVPDSAAACFRRVVQRLGPVPPAYRSPKAQKGRGPILPKDLPKDLAVQTIWWLAPPTPVDPPPMTPQGVEGRRSFADIQTEVRRHLPGLLSCFGELWEDHPHAAGTLVLRLTIAESGQVDAAEVLRREPTMRAAEPCLLRVAGRLRFPTRWGGGRTVMSYPLVLSPAEAAE